MSWRIIVRPEVEKDITDASDWYFSHDPELGVRFLVQLEDVWSSLRLNPFLNSRRHPSKDVRWRYPKTFPYRVIYQVDEEAHTVTIIAVIHAARSHVHWKKRL